MNTKPQPTVEQKRPKLRWFQYRLRSLFLLTFLLSLGMSYVAVTIQQQRHQYYAAKAIGKAGGAVAMEQTWLGKLLRDNSLVNVTAVYMRIIDASEIDEATVQHLDD
ncbi:MAG: hypothetical protein ABFC96_11635, partial [Thermoguttaceae bacterium]